MFSAVEYSGLWFVFIQLQFRVLVYSLRHCRSLPGSLQYVSQRINDISYFSATICIKCMLRELKPLI